MDVLLEILKITFPALVVFLTALFVLKALMKKEVDVVQGMLHRDAENRRLEVMKTTNKAIIPIRLQAYERMSLFCSRIEIGQLVSNTNTNPTIPAELYKSQLIISVEEEFNHNITQQIYMTDELWNIILLAKKEVTQIFEKLHSDLQTKYADEGLQGEPSAQQFLALLVEYLKNTPQIGYVHALSAIKKEIGVLFN
jgi:hypothetical protein